MRTVLNLLLTGMALTSPAWANLPGEGFALNAGITEVAPRNFSVIVVQQDSAQEAAAAKLHRHLPNALAKLNHHIGENRLRLEDWIQGNRPGDLHWREYRRRKGLIIIRSEAMDSAPEATSRVLGFCLPGGRDRDKPHSLHAEIVICSKLLGPDGNPDQLDHTLLHELMHFLGLDHFETPYRGETQIMHSMEDPGPVLKQGDIHGLQYLVRDQLFVESKSGDPRGAFIGEPVLWSGPSPVAPRPGKQVTLRGVHLDTIMTVVAGGAPVTTWFEEPRDGSELLDLTFKLPAGAVAGPDGLVVQVHGPGGSASVTLTTPSLQPEPEEGDGQMNGCRTQ